MPVTAKGAIYTAINEIHSISSSIWLLAWWGKENKDLKTINVWKKDIQGTMES